MKCGRLGPLGSNLGPGSRVALVGCFLLLAFSSVGYSDDIETLSTVEIVEELASINARQTVRLNELEMLLQQQTERQQLSRLRLSVLSESYMRLQTTMNEQHNYSQSLEGEIVTLTRHRRLLLLALAVSATAAVVGWIF